MKRSLLIADDSVEAVQLLIACLRDDYAITPSYTAQDTIAALRSIHFDAVLLDLGFGDMAMNEFCRQVAEIKDHSRIIVLTGYDRRDIAPQIETLDARAVLRKPVTIDKIMEAINVVVGGGSDRDG